MLDFEQNCHGAMRNHRRVNWDWSLRLIQARFTSPRLALYLMAWLWIQSWLRGGKWLPTYWASSCCIQLKGYPNQGAIMLSNLVQVQTVHTLQGYLLLATPPSLRVFLPCDIFFVEWALCRAQHSPSNSYSFLLLATPSLNFPFLFLLL